MLGEEDAACWSFGAKFEAEATPTRCLSLEERFSSLATAASMLGPVRVMVAFKFVIEFTLTWRLLIPVTETIPAASELNVVEDSTTADKVR